MHIQIVGIESDRLLRWPLVDCCYSATQKCKLKSTFHFAVIRDTFHFAVIRDTYAIVVVDRLL